MMIKVPIFRQKNCPPLHYYILHHQSVYVCLYVVFSSRTKSTRSIELKNAICQKKILQIIQILTQKFVCVCVYVCKCVLFVLKYFRNIYQNI